MPFYGVPEMPAPDTDTKPTKPKVAARERLVLAAAALFAEKGFDGVTVREICKAAGTSINMIHHYFETKDGLLNEILSRYDQEVFAVPLRLMQTPPASPDDLISRVGLVFETTLEAAIKERDMMLVAFRTQAQLSTLEAFQTAMSGFLSAAQDAGFVREGVDCAMITGAMLDRIVNQVQFAPWLKKSYGIDLATDTAYRSRWCAANVDLFLNGMLPR